MRTANGRRCSACHADKPLAEFYGAYDSLCRPCHRDYMREYQRQHKHATSLTMAVSLYRRFRDDPAFLERVRAADHKAEVKARPIKRIVLKEAAQ